MLDAIAGALRLDESERRYLHDLVRADRGRTREPGTAPERATEATVQLLDGLADVPAIVLGRRSDVLAWNRLGHALFAGDLGRGAPDLPAQRPNMARLVFLDSHTREASSAACRAAARNEAGPGPAFPCRGVELGG
ncbi:hypothetical protein [Streptomyces sp. NBC_00555]|uniref:MmyB family transcriptional regulator n=1 Tax=Streptomyces sp. NBC_00555 TaxID=2903662 RepID=UPI002B1E656E|nr:hypothetical protein [Streptomyces sp. NBC_00555]